MPVRLLLLLAPSLRLPLAGGLGIFLIGLFIRLAALIKILLHQYPRLFRTSAISKYLTQVVTEEAGAELDTTSCALRTVEFHCCFRLDEVRFHRHNVHSVHIHIVPKSAQFLLLKGGRYSIISSSPTVYLLHPSFAARLVTE